MSKLTIKTTGKYTADIFLDDKNISSIVSSVFISIDPSCHHTAIISIVPEEIEIEGDLKVLVKELKDKYGKDKETY